MNAPVDRADVLVTASPDGVQEQFAASNNVTDATVFLADAAPAVRETAPADGEKICWVQVHQSPYPPDQQVELLHLQAEAEALLLQLQAMHQRRLGLPQASRAANHE